MIVTRMFHPERGPARATPQRSHRRSRARPANPNGRRQFQGGSDVLAGLGGADFYRWRCECRYGRCIPGWTVTTKLSRSMEPPPAASMPVIISSWHGAHSNGNAGPGAACSTRPDDRFLLDLVVKLPEADGALGRLHRQLAEITLRDLQRLLADRRLYRPVAQDRFDRRPVQAC